MHYFLGIHVTRNSSGFLLNQTKYAQDLLKKFSMEKSSLCPTPMVAYSSLSACKGVPISNPTDYRSAIGALQYLTYIRPDLSFTVNKLSQFLQSPTSDHWKALKRVFRYIQGTLNLGIQIQCSPNLQITGFSDSDWTTSVDDHKSVGGYCVFLGDSLISWSSQKQRMVSRSSSESEYRALVDLAVEVLWIQYLLKEIQFPFKNPSVLWCDNVSASALAQNPVFHSRSKHIELDIHFIRDKVLENFLEIRYVSSLDQVANIFTKSLSHS